MSPPSNRRPPSIDDEDKRIRTKILQGCLVVFFIPIILILSISLLIIGLTTPPNPSVSLLSVTSASDNATTSATTSTGASFTTQNITAMFSISSRNKAAVIYTHLRVTGSQEGSSEKSRGFISAASARSLVQSGPSTDTIAFDQPNSTVVIESWATNLNNNSVRTGFSGLELSLHLTARYVRKRLTVPVRADCPYQDNLLAEIVDNGQDAPQLYFTRHVFRCDVSSTWDSLGWTAFPCLALLIIVGLIIFCISLPNAVQQH